MVVLTNLPPPTEGIRLTQPQTVALLQNQNLGLGTLYIAESCVSWVGEGGGGFSLEYPAISLHAVSRDLSTFPQECLYVMLEVPASERRKRKRCLPQIFTEQMAHGIASLGTSDSHISHPEPSAALTTEITGMSVGSGGEGVNGEGAGVSGEEGEEEEEPITEVRFIPVDKSIIDDLFKSMSECQTLHPDENDSFSEEEEEDEGVDGGGGDGEWFTSAEDAHNLNPEGQAVLQRIMANQQGDGMEVDEANMETGQFDDAPPNE